MYELRAWRCCGVARLEGSAGSAGVRVVGELCQSQELIGSQYESPDLDLWGPALEVVAVEEGGTSPEPNETRSEQSSKTGQIDWRKESV
jgi:hypothetical protein